MEQILVARDASVKFLKKYEFFILPILRFLLGFYVFSLIGRIGHGAEALEILTGPSMRMPFAMLMGLLFSILPIGMGYFLIALNIIAQFSASPEVAVMVGAVLLLILFSYGRLGGSERWLLIFMLLGFYLRIPYIVPLIAGLYFGIQSVFPITIGIFLWEFYPFTFELMNVERPVAETIIDIPESFGLVFSYGIEIVTANDQWIAVAFVYALVVLIVFAASKMDVDFSKEIAILLGVVINIVSFIFLRLAVGLDVNIFAMILLSVVSGLIVLFIKLFDVILNYQRAERVEFEDDEYYYFVKVVPKMTISRRQRKIRKIRGTQRDAQLHDDVIVADYNEAEIDTYDSAFEAGHTQEFDVDYGDFEDDEE